MGALIVACGAPKNAIKRNNNQLLSAIERSDTALAIELFNKGENVNAKSGLGTSLRSAIRQHLKEIVKLLIAKGADVNAKAFQIGDDVAKGGV